MNHTIWFARAGTALVAVSLVVPAFCSQADARSSAGTSTAVEESATIPTGGTLTLGGNSVIRGFDPATFPPANNPIIDWVGASVYDTLVRVEADGTIVPRLAESVESEDFVTWTVTLRSGVTFSDDSPLNAEAVKVNWDRHNDPATASRCAGQTGAMESITVVDDLTLEVILNAPNTTFPRALVGCLGLIASAQAIADGVDLVSTPVGAGPFVLTEWVPEDQATLDRNPTYWDAPRPYIDTLVFKPILDQQQRADALTTGQIDYGLFPFGGPYIEDLANSGFDVQSIGLSGGTGVIFNLGKAPLDDARVRQAFAMAIDVNAINEIATAGFGQVADSWFPEDSPFHDPDVVQRTTDLAAAQALIDDYVAENGPVVTTFQAPEGFKIQAEAVHQQISQLDGVELTLELIPNATRTQIVADRAFDMTIESSAAVDPGEMYNFFYSGSAADVTGYSAVDDLLVQSRATPGVDDLTSIFSEVTAAVFEDVPFFIINRSVYQTVFSERVGGAVLYDAGLTDTAAIFVNE